MENTGGTPVERRVVSVSLRSRGSRPRYFIADREIELLDGVACPLVHEGREYAFSHTLRPTWRYGRAEADEIYVFSETDANP